MNRILSNIAAGVAQAAIVVAIITAAVAWRGTAADFGANMTPMFVLQGFLAVAFIMALAFGGTQKIWNIVADDFGLKGISLDALGCAATMLLFGGIWLASGGLEKDFSIISVVLMTVGASFAGCVRYWVAKT